MKSVPYVDLRAHHGPIEEEIRANLEDRERILLSSWFSTEPQKQLREATETF